MNEFENNNNQPNDTLSGFDSVNDNDTGYTVTPNGSFYSKKSDEIIQDNATQNAPQPQTPPTYTASYTTPPQKPQKDKKTHSTAVVIIACVLAAIIGAASSFAVSFSVFQNNTDDDDKQSETQISQPQTNDGNSTNVTINVDETASSVAEAVATKCSDSVVGIRTTTSVTGFLDDSMNQTGDGSGVVYTADGHIITNYHVIADAVEYSKSKINVYVGDSTSDPYSATVVGYNISCDLAVIKIEAKNLTPIELGDSDDLKIGQSVITIGAPGGIEFMGSVTFGIISGLDRIVSADSQLELIQTDAAINPGNSGGALLDSKGRLIGINSSKIASVEYEGMGFAIPINTVKEKCDKIISHQGEARPYLGVSISTTYTSDVLSYYGFPSGAVVSSVVEDSPAYEAGLERGDIITEFAGVKISEYTMLNDALYDCEPDETVEATVYRNGKYYSVDITLASDTSN